MYNNNNNNNNNTVIHVDEWSFNSSLKLEFKFIIFGKIWFETMYYSIGTFVRFGVTLKIRKKSKFYWNQFKLETQHKYMYMYQGKL